jgi:hypothetical protein
MAYTLPPRTTRLAKASHAYALAAGLIPKRGAAYLQSAAVRKLARGAFRAARTRQGDLQSEGA